MNEGVSYTLFYDILQNLREYFHSYGRLDDSNAKLDEITKLISVSYSLANRGIRFGVAYVKSKILDYKVKEKGRIKKSIESNDITFAMGLRKIFEEEARQPLFMNEDGTSVFGADPSLNIQPTENDLAEKIVSEIEKIDFLSLITSKQYSDFDLINECFGHFVRDNFRNNKEDAQYMTPLEIVEPVLEVIFSDMEKEGIFDNQTEIENFTIMDPTCGVGTLLMQSSNYFTKYIQEHIGNKTVREDTIANFRACGMLGQDKVDRMVRLSKINVLLLGGNISNITIGNSIVGDSPISKYKGKINFIFTNPPFGAEYLKTELSEFDYPLLSKISTNSENYPSELLMLDKCISMLKENGYLAIVLPDAVFSAKGLYAEYREILLKNVAVKAVFELPSVTFAQAGTRTNTCILYLQKKKAEEQNIYMSICNDVGYLVKERGGVPVKVKTGCNDMLTISSEILSHESNKGIVSENPSVTYISGNDLIDNSLNPTFYAADRLKTIEKLSSFDESKISILPLSDLADFVTKSRKIKSVDSQTKHISVLHINPDTTISFSEVMKFNPVCKGRVCREGDILFSKINPRIPRMTVVPKSNYTLVCSNEFEILNPKGDLNPYALCHLLRTEIVRKQIINLTSGTSSSHNRIKTDQLKEIKLPIYINKSIYNDLGQRLKKAIDDIYQSEEIIESVLKEFESID